jgi:hypothetical protein
MSSAIEYFPGNWNTGEGAPLQKFLAYSKIIIKKKKKRTM